MVSTGKYKCLFYLCYRDVILLWAREGPLPAPVFGSNYQIKRAQNNFGSLAYLTLKTPSTLHKIVKVDLNELEVDLNDLPNGVDQTWLDKVY